MAKDKKAFILYADQREIFEDLPDDYAGKLVKHIFKYINDENPETDDLLLKIAFNPIKAQLKRDLKKYEAKSVIRSEIGRKGGIASGEARRSKTNQNEAIGSKLKQNEQDIDIVKDKGIVIDKDKEINIVFDVFWNLYDKKKDRPKCERKWNNLKDRERELIISYIPAYKESTQDKQYRKDPATFLNNRSWENEILITAEEGKAITYKEVCDLSSLHGAHIWDEYEQITPGDKRSLWRKKN